MNNSLYRNFYKQFLLVMLLPTVILTITILCFSSYIFLNNMKSQSSTIGSTLEQEINTYTKQLSNCRSTLINDSFVVNDLSGMAPYDKYQLIQHFNDYKDILGYCSNIGIIDITNQKMISSSGESSVSVIFDTIDLDFIMNFLETTGSSSLLCPYETSTTVNFLYITKQKADSDLYLFFTFNSYRLYSTILNQLKSSEGFVLLNNISSNEFFSLRDNADELIPEHYKEYAISYDENSAHSFCSSALVSHFEIPAYHFNFFVFLPFASMRYMLLTIIGTAMGVVVFSFCTGLFLVRYMARANYIPIQQIEGMIPPEHRSANGNELAQINHAIVHMNERIGDLNTKLYLNRENIKKSILIKLLYRQYTSEQEFLADAHVINVQHLHPYFTVYVLHYESEKKAPVLYEHLCKKEDPSYQCFRLNNLETKQMVLIYNFPEVVHNAKELAEQLYQELYHIYNANITIGVSEECQSFDQIPQLYDQAVRAVNYSFYTGNKPITFTTGSDSNNPEASAPLPEINYDRLEKCILDCDSDLLMQFFYDIFETIQKSNHSMNTIKIYLFNMFSHIRQILSHLNISDYQIIENELTSIFMNAETLEELFNLLYTVLLEIGKNLHTVSDDEKIEMIQQYIYDHLCDMDFNVNSISDYFHISMPTLSRFYKQKKGQNISAFISDLKMDKAKELLVKSDYSIDYIVEKLGYSNTSSFIRKFKTMVGITPGQYRSTYKDTSV